MANPPPGLPSELLVKIVGFVAPDDRYVKPDKQDAYQEGMSALRQLCLTSRLLGNLATKHLYHRVILNRHRGTADSPGAHPGAGDSVDCLPRFMRTMFERPDLRSYTRHLVCFISFSTDDRNEGTQDAIRRAWENTRETFMSWPSAQCSLVDDFGFSIDEGDLLGQAIFALILFMVHNIETLHVLWVPSPIDELPDYSFMDACFEQLLDQKSNLSPEALSLGSPPFRHNLSGDDIVPLQKLREVKFEPSTIRYHVESSWEHVPVIRFAQNTMVVDVWGASNGWSHLPPRVTSITNEHFVLKQETLLDFTKKISGLEHLRLTCCWPQDSVHSDHWNPALASSSQSLMSLSLSSAELSDFAFYFGPIGRLHSLRCLDSLDSLEVELNAVIGHATSLGQIRLSDVLPKNISDLILVERWHCVQDGYSEPDPFYKPVLNEYKESSRVYMDKIIAMLIDFAGALPDDLPHLRNFRFVRNMGHRPKNHWYKATGADDLKPLVKHFKSKGVEFHRRFGDGSMR